MVQFIDLDILQSRCKQYEHAISMINIFQWFPTFLWMKFNILRGHEAHITQPQLTSLTSTSAIIFFSLCLSLSLVSFISIMGMLPPTPSLLQTQVVFGFSQHHLYGCIYLFSSESLDPDPLGCELIAPCTLLSSMYHSCKQIVLLFVELIVYSSMIMSILGR